MTAERSAPSPGFGLVEAIVALTIGSILLALVAGSVRTGALAARHAGATADAADAVRAAALLLAAELRPLEPGADLSGTAWDSLHLRAFRGIAIPCDTAMGAIVGRYRGLRDPDPAKDSILALTAAGEFVVALTAAAGGSGCTTRPGERLFRFTTAPALPAGAELLALFESGAYHLSGAALRYRRGAGGRQPLTAEVLDDAASGFTLPGGADPLAPRGLGVALAAAPVPWGAAGTSPPLPPLRLELGFLNRPAWPDTLS